MSGVAGADRVKSRQDFSQFLASYKELVSQFPGFVSMVPSGSYNSNLEKQDFGDIDLVVHIQSDKDKTALKKEMVAFFAAQPDTTIVPFTSPKYTGKRTYNSGEIVTVRYHDDQLGYSAQIDNIIALDQSEATFKQSFLDLPAEKQGLILGLVKISTIETEPALLFQKLGLKIPAQLEPNQEFEFNLSSIELQLRKVTYEPGSYKQAGREVLWSSRSFDDLRKLLYQYDLDADFDNLLAQTKQTIKNPRSSDRIKGVFSSMITVKSGEVGTAKGAGKEAALAKINQTLSESKFSDYLKYLTEAQENKDTMVFTFGRFQVPTKGHQVLINEVKGVAQQHHADYAIFVSKKVGTTTVPKYENPLTIDQKMPYITEAFPGTNFIPCNDQMSTIIQIAQYINQKYKKIVMVAGKDRMEGTMNFKELLTKQNGVDFQFDDIQFVTVSRDPDAESSSKMKEFVTQDNWEAFRHDLPSALDDRSARQLWEDLKVGLAPVARKKPERKPKEIGVGNPGEQESLELESIKRLAGIGRGSNAINTSNNLEMPAAEKARLMKEHNIQPGTPEWFQLWFSRPYMTGEKPIGK
jgi:hypothetical protein